MKTYDRKKDVPAEYGRHAKLCPKCEHWFAAAKRRRICNNCNRPNRRWDAVSAVKYEPRTFYWTRRVNGVKAQLTRSRRATPRTLIREADNLAAVIDQHPELERYLANVCACILDYANGEPWTRHDQMRHLGMVFR